ncbi:hypothetical protein MMC29_006216 [Sticta canariensis]|nr:hypothetical protein [Sticta canariensis]
MAPIRSIMLCALLAISMTAAVPVPGKMPEMPSDDKIPTPLQHHHGVLTVPAPKESQWYNSINGNHHHDVPSSPVPKKSHWRYLINGNRYRHPVKPQQSSPAKATRRQNSAMGKMASGAVQGVVTASTTLFSDYVSDSLTGNDKDHPQKTKEQLEAEKDGRILDA